MYQKVEPKLEQMYRNIEPALDQVLEAGGDSLLAITKRIAKELQNILTGESHITTLDEAENDDLPIAQAKDNSNNQPKTPFFSIKRRISITPNKIHQSSWDHVAAAAAATAQAEHNRANNDEED